MSIVFKSVNWTQGMSVSSSHFIATENYLMERLMLSTAVLQEKFAYGLLPMNGGDAKDMQIKLEGKGDGAKIVLSSYRGITKGGCFVEIDPSQPVVCECYPELDMAEYGWDIVLSVSPFGRHPCGEPDMQETPPRYPYVDPVYKLSVVERDKEHVNEYGAFDVVVGSLRKKGGEFRLDNEYISPALSMSSHSKLRKYMEIFSQSASTIKGAMEIINEKSNASGSNKTKCMENTLIFCRELQRSMANADFRWRSYESTMSPYQVAEIFGGIANAVLLSFTFMSKADKDEMLKYFYEWNGIAPSAFEQVLGDVAFGEYRQNRIDTSMMMINRMLRVLEDLMVNLGKLDYVGQRKESLVVSVSSAKDESGQSKRRSWLL